MSLTLLHQGMSLAIHFASRDALNNILQDLTIFSVYQLEILKIRKITLSRLEIYPETFLIFTKHFRIDFIKNHIYFYLIKQSINFKQINY